jgi:hypothetical protein
MKKFITVLIFIFMACPSSAVNWVSAEDDWLGKGFIDLDSIKRVESDSSVVTAYDRTIINTDASELTHERAYNCRDKSTAILNTQFYDGKKIHSATIHDNYLSALQKGFLPLASPGTTIYQKWYIVCSASGYKMR